MFYFSLDNTTDNDTIGNNADTDTYGVLDTNDVFQLDNTESVDTNVNDAHIIDWNIPERYNIEVSANQQSIFIKPESLELTTDEQGLLTLSVQITDRGTGDTN